MFKKYIVITIVISVIAGMTMYFICKFARGEHTAEMNRKYNEAVQSSDAWKMKFVGVIDQMHVIEDSLRRERRKADSAIVKADVYRDSADVLHRKLDQMVKPAPTDSTNPKWMHLYQIASAESEQRKNETVYLRSVIVSDSVQIRFKQREVDAWRTTSFQADTAIGKLRESLELERNKYDCKIILWKCPSRKASFVAGSISAVTVLGIGYIETQKYRNRK